MVEIAKNVAVMTKMTPIIQPKKRQKRLKAQEQHHTDRIGGGEQKAQIPEIVECQVKKVIFP